MAFKGGLSMNSIEWLQQFYFERCNNQWEHRYGVSIETLDNPGWLVTIDLRGTPMQGLALRELGEVGTINHSGANGPHDWLNCKFEDQQVVGAGGPLSLFLICDVFRNWVDQNSRPEQTERRSPSEP